MDILESMRRICSICRIEKPIEEFGPSGSTGSWRRSCISCCEFRKCGSCHVSKSIDHFKYRSWLRRDCEDCRKAADRKRQREQQVKNRENERLRCRRNHLKRQQIVFEHFGAKCACCGETEPCFLTVDHIGGGGGKLRHKGRHGSIYIWLIKNNFPAGFQLLCTNCNHGRYRNGGICPHQEGSTIRLQSRSPKRGEVPRNHLTHEWFMI